MKKMNVPAVSGDAAREARSVAARSNNKGNASETFESGNAIFDGDNASNASGQQGNFSRVGENDISYSQRYHRFNVSEDSFNMSNASRARFHIAAECSALSGSGNSDSIARKSSRPIQMTRR